MGKSIQTVQGIPAGVALRYADKARNGEGVQIGDSGCWEIPHANSVVTLMSLDPANGYMKRDPRRADQLRAMLAAREASEPGE